MTKLSVVVPARNEPYLQNTITELLAKASGEVEVIAVLDGYWPNPPLSVDKRLVILHRGEARGMREGINAGFQIASGDYFMKIDAHCMVSEGYDEVLKADCEEDWVVVPRRKRLDAENWKVAEDKRPDVDYQYLYPPLEDPLLSPEGMRSTHYFKGQNWDAKTRERAGVPVDDLMIFQGSCWFTTRKHIARTLREMDSRFGTLHQEAQEVALKTWLSGGRMVVNKKCWYAHLHKQSRGYAYSNDDWVSSLRTSADYWMNNRWAGATRKFEWYIDHFWPVPSWPEGWKGMDWAHMLDEGNALCQN